VLSSWTREGKKKEKGDDTRHGRPARKRSLLSFCSEDQGKKVHATSLCYLEGGGEGEKGGEEEGGTFVLSLVKTPIESPTNITPGERRAGRKGEEERARQRHCRLREKKKGKEKKGGGKSAARTGSEDRGRQLAIYRSLKGKRPGGGERKPEDPT